MTATALSVVVADDQPLIRSALVALLETYDDVEVVGEAADGAAAVDLVRRLRPSAVVMDIRMPVLDGIAATRLITESQPEVAVVVLTTFDLDEYVFGAIRAGASGFLLKDADTDELVSALRHAVAGDALMSPRALRRLLAKFAAGPQPDQRAVRAVASLTPREREVLVLMSGGLTNTEIAERLVIGEATVKTHVGSILAKLGARDRVSAVVTAYDADIALRDR
jgi:DNA-binding NarL/FixJ family response regulator